MIHSRESLNFYIHFCMRSFSHSLSFVLVLFGLFCVVLGALWLFFTWTEPSSPAQMGYPVSFGMLCFGLLLCCTGWILFNPNDKSRDQKK